MKKVGVLLDRTECDSCLAAIIESLASNSGVELHLILNIAQQGLAGGFLRRILAKMRSKGLRRGAAILIFQALAGLELRLLARVSARAARYLTRRDVGSCTQKEIVRIRPVFSKSGLFVHYSKDDLDELRSYEFDLLIRGNNSGILQGGILDVARDGILSFHHGDNSWNRGLPPGFWEVYRRCASTGFVIQTLTEELDGGNVVLKGSFATKPTYSQNVVHLCTESNVHFIRIIEEYVRTSSLPEAHPSMPHGERLLVLPRVGQSVSYLFRTMVYLARASLRRLAGREVRWQIAFVPRDWQQANLRKGTIIANPVGRFLADPFVVERNGRTVCFAEDYDFSTRRAAISAVELHSDGSYEFLGKVLEERYHMSFPFLFEFEGQLYMVPEAVETQSVRIYRCAEFPKKWCHVATPLTGISASDPMIFAHGSKWWMAVNIAPAGAVDSTSQLHLFHNDDPLRETWTPHRGNPVIFDSICARNGGLVIGHCGRLFRVSQRQGFGTYGIGINIAEVIRLDHESYEERIVHQIGPSFFPGILMCHHLHSNGHFTVYDFAKRGRTT